MFDIGWTEMFLIIVVAIIVIGPKDLPRALRTVGQWVGKARSIGRDFQRGIDDMIREAELDDMKKQFDDARKLDLKKEAENTIDPTGTIRDTMKPMQISEKDSRSGKRADDGAEGEKTPEAADEGTAKAGAETSTPFDERAPTPTAKTGT